jgi:antitoxin VapB
MERLRTKVFKSGGSQAVRLPKQLRLKTNEVEIWREGDELRLRPVGGNVSEEWDRFFAEIDRIGFDLTIEDRDQPPMPPDRISFDSDDR